MPGREPYRREAGFAMLVVFLLAGIIAIGLYMELPRVVLEAQRGREELLIERGEQYKRAIQLFYRRYGRYPPSMDALENTDNRRFLRRRYKDPMTGEEEWRVITAAGPGVFLDSLVYAPPGAQNQQTGITAATGAEETETPIWLQRRPSDLMILAQLGERPLPLSIEPETDSRSTELPPASVAETAPPAGQQVDEGQPASKGEGEETETASARGPVPVMPGIGVPPPVPTGPPPPQMPGMPPTQVGVPIPILPGQIAAQPGQATPAAGAPGQTTNPALEMIQRILTTPNPRGLASLPTAPGVPQQQTQTGGIAGVASKLEAEGIKVYNDRTKYNEWEFLYDVRQDPLAAAAAAGRGGQQGQGRGGAVDNSVPLPGTGGRGFGGRGAQPGRGGQQGPGGRGAQGGPPGGFGGGFGGPAGGFGGIPQPPGR